MVLRKQLKHLVLHPQPGDCPWARAALGMAVGLGCSKGPRSSGEGAVGVGWHPLPQMSRIFTGSSQNKALKALLSGGRDSWWLWSSMVCCGSCAVASEVEKAGNLCLLSPSQFSAECLQNMRSALVSKRSAGETRYQGWLSQSQQHLATGSIPCSCTPGRSQMPATMQLWGNRRKQKGWGKEKGRAGWCCEGCPCTPPRRLPQPGLHNLQKCKSFCSSLLGSSVQLKINAVCLSELVALSKQAGRERKRCPLKERKGKQAQWPVHRRMEI